VFTRPTSQETARTVQRNFSKKMNEQDAPPCAAPDVMSQGVSLLRRQDMIQYAREQKHKQWEDTQARLAECREQLQEQKDYLETAEGSAHAKAQLDLQVKKNDDWVRTHNNALRAWIALMKQREEEQAKKEC